ncbi:hypothetical protein ACFQS7_21570 [Dankookia sp. GCM10030260]|uniref:hypothetical protein n=1 Tax=Dankookia sp. GCM10030260 TaxID=3273390 RepID=UPI00361DED1E
MRRMLLLTLAGPALCLAGCAASPPPDMPRATPQAEGVRAPDTGRSGTDQGVATPGGFGAGDRGRPTVQGGLAPPHLAPPTVTRAPRP